VLGVRDATLQGESVIASQVFFRDTTIVVDCAPPGTVFHIFDTVLATGSATTNLNSVRHTATNDPLWSNFIMKKGITIEMQIDSAHILTLEPGGAVVVAEDFTVPANTNGTWSDVFTVTTVNGDTMRVRATIIATYRAGSVSTNGILFPIVPYKSAPITSSFTVMDTTAAPVTVSWIALQPGWKYNSSYSISTFPSLPDVLQQGQSVLVTVTFDPSVSPDSNQTAALEITSDACNIVQPIGVWAQATSAVAERSAGHTDASLVNADGGRSLRAVLPEGWSGIVHLDLENLLGERVFTRSFNAASDKSFEVNTLVPGVYFYRLSCGAESASGKILVQR